MAQHLKSNTTHNTELCRLTLFLLLVYVVSMYARLGYETVTSHEWIFRKCEFLLTDGGHSLNAWIKLFDLPDRERWRDRPCVYTELVYVDLKIVYMRIYMFSSLLAEVWGFVTY